MIYTTIIIYHLLYQNINYVINIKYNEYYITNITMICYIIIYKFYKLKY